MRNEQKLQTAIALSYNETLDEAPRVKAKGKGFVATEIIERAKEHHIPIQEDPSLVELLSQLEINETIPTELFEVVAEVFAFIYRIDKNHNKDSGSSE
ncbi:EscU/YscU/HrcU family type III secretion system export apparatus switch protein [Alkalihalobacterium chitinilyticum]|uniref:EscU/YscU/HrcU family type III secretion system export apparatus switch protein n=1 Tax=Alkalihalobacterium chitinilyticum TaxID=2980103 RepID=A0ABT5VC00_9BACI|nr:EscU/YscU/HrcU family type III secretion system export apparatus switch protein [Alkalihalobacterium chitinilyticum]MDE5412984.1 EscU/YscU/HrcU family type III secretion system export apparatus switch protein [Alkalihalobacterium chitinilyticum]